MLIIMELLVSRSIWVFPIHSQIVSLRRKVVICFACCLLFNTIPHSIDCLLIIHSFEDTIATNQEEVKVWFQFETLYFRFTYYDVRVSSIFRTLSFDVSESSRYRQTSRENSERALDV